MNETRELARLLSELKYEDLPEAVVSQAKDLILDQLGVELACSTKPWSRAIYAYIRDFGGNPESTIVNYGDKTKAENAAFANAIFGHGFEIDDRHTPSLSHPGCMVVASALALAERELVGGKDLVLAAVAGYEATGRIGKAVYPRLLGRGFHPTSALGTFGAATVAGKLLGFDGEMMLNALSIAASHSAGITEYMKAGGSVKRVHAGMAAQGGLRAALLAQRGITGPASALEGGNGFCKAFAGEYNLDDLTANFGRRFIVNEITYKRHCCCGQLHSAIDAILNIKQKHDFKPEDIEEVVTGTAEQAIKEVGVIREPKDIMGAQFSAYFSLAMTLVKGSNDFNDYTEESLKDPQIAEMAKRIRMEWDEEQQAIFPGKVGARVTIKLKDGTVYEDKVTEMKGSPANPMTKEEVQAKSRKLASVVLPAGQVEEIVRVVEGLEGMESVAGLCALLSR